ncbi:5765_t:CDS:2, partial [Racocetra persica]
TSPTLLPTYSSWPLSQVTIDKKTFVYDEQEIYKKNADNEIPKNKKHDLMRVAPYIHWLNIGAQPKYPQLENELLDIANKLDYHILYPDIDKYKFSHKWVNRFMTHHSLVNRRNNTVAQ